VRALAFVLLLAGCGPPEEADEDGLVDVELFSPAQVPLAPATTCTVKIGRDPAEGASHLDVCSETSYVTHPPAAGSHYRQWADFATYDAPVPWGYLVHSLEHGAVVLVHSCDAAECPEVLDAFARIHDATDDPLCRDHPNANRIVTVYDPSVEVPIAAVAWGHAYRATCLDEASLTAFVEEHYAQAPENLCFAGVASPDC
jgi:hypothetical protein